MAQETWIVFGRREYQEALTQLGKLAVGADADAVREAAKREYGEDWLELVAIPEHRMSWAIREG